jgi:hypothetical protein
VERLEAVELLASQLAAQTTVLADIRAELRLLNGHFRPTAAPEPALLLSILGYVGVQSSFSASELVQADDRLIREAIAGMNVYEVGHALSDLEGKTALGRVLTRRPRSVDGNQWEFT